MTVEDRYLELLYKAQPLRPPRRPEVWPDDWVVPVRQAAVLYRSSTDAERLALRDLTASEQLRPLFGFASRMAIDALASKDVGDVEAGLTALAMTADKEDYREVLIVMTLLVRSAERLGRDGLKLLASTKGWGDKSWDALVDDFLASPRTVEQMDFEEEPAGYKQVIPSFGPRRPK